MIQQSIKNEITRLFQKLGKYPVDENDLEGSARLAYQHLNTDEGTTLQDFIDTAVYFHKIGKIKHFWPRGDELVTWCYQTFMKPEHSYLAEHGLLRWAGDRR